MQLAHGVNEVWSMDFVSDSLANGRRIKFLTVADDCSMRQAHPDRAGTSHAERLHRQLQRQVPGRCLNEQRFKTLHQARSAPAVWRLD